MIDEPSKHSAAYVHLKLREAAMLGSEAGLKALLQDPCSNVLIKDRDGRTALMHAAYYGHPECVGILLPKSDALARDKHGKTALIWAVIKQHKACVQFLLSVSDILAQDHRGITASAWAQRFPNESLAQLIDAYALAQSEQMTICVSVGSGAQHGWSRHRL